MAKQNNHIFLFKLFLEVKRAHIALLSDIMLYILLCKLLTFALIFGDIYSLYFVIIPYVK